jgi:hypothetical protein
MVDGHLVTYYIGIAIIFITHLYMLIMPQNMSANMVRVHAGLNLAAALMIAYYFTHKEGFIKW